jgi:hypothetical protein
VSELAVVLEQTKAGVRAGVRGGEWGEVTVLESAQMSGLELGSALAVQSETGLALVWAPALGVGMGGKLGPQLAMVMEHHLELEWATEKAVG